MHYSVLVQLSEKEIVFTVNCEVEKFSCNYAQ